ncbi:hypothetical protein [Lysinibacillus xylanilyticus]|uniref:hypothetical protein n=1 Tax=Lysinibacillus xylanilyticus TaxID=582475 RepID=UPI0038182124
MPIQQTVTPQQMVPPQLQPGMVYNQHTQLNATLKQMDQLFYYLNNFNKGY